jgi:hypothetical protein
MGWITPQHREGVTLGWSHWMDRIRQLAEQKAKSKK